MELFIGLTVGMVLSCLGALIWNRYSLLCGFLFDCLLMGIAIWVTKFAVELQEYYFIRFIIVVASFVFFLILSFGIFILCVFFFTNAHKVLKREGHKLANMLTLFAGVGITLYIIATVLVIFLEMPTWFNFIWALVTFILLILLFHVIIYLTTMILDNFMLPRYNKDYVIVLGSGLIDGKAPPLLQRRIDKGIAFLNKQQKKTGKEGYLILSGGQGKDEPRSEASAMREYALTAGVRETLILLEENSSTTEENLLYSKYLIEERQKGRTGKEKELRCAVVTNNYHLMRAGILARKMGMRVSGIGCKTAGYYLPNAVMREYIAYLSLRKKRLIVIGILMVLFAVVLEVR